MGDPIVRLEGVSRSFGAREALSEIDFGLRPGEFVGLVGRNGAGKTTAIRLMTGVIAATGGSVKVFGQTMSPDNARLKARLGYVPSECLLFEHLTAWEHLLFTAAAYRLDRAQAVHRATELLDLLDLTAEKHRRIHGYSFGMKKKAAIACALIHNPDVLFLDEPIEGLDVMTASGLKELFRFLRRNGKTILLTSHNFDLVDDLCERIAIIERGRLLFDGDSARLRQEAGLAETARLEDAFLARFEVRPAPRLSWVSAEMEGAR